MKFQFFSITVHKFLLCKYSLLPLRSSIWISSIFVHFNMKSKKKISLCLNCRKKSQTMDSDLSDQETEDYAKSLNNLTEEQNNLTGNFFILYLLL